MRVYICTCRSMCICMYMQMFSGLVLRFDTNIHKQSHSYVHVYSCVLAYIHTYIHAYIRTHTHTYSTHTACVSIHAYLQHISADYAMHVLYIFVRYPCESCCLASEPRCNPSATCLRAVTCSSISRPSFSASYLNVASLASCSTLYTVHRTVSYSNARSALL